MSNIDNIFRRVLADEQLVREFNINAARINSVSDGKRAVNPQVKAIAEILDQLNKKISETKSDMNIRKKSGPVVLADSDFQTIYKKVVAQLSK